MVHDKDGKMTRPYLVIEADSREEMILALQEMVTELQFGDPNCRGGCLAKANFDYDMGDDSIPDYWTRSRS